MTPSRAFRSIIFVFALALAGCSGSILPSIGDTFSAFKDGDVGVLAGVFASDGDAATANAAMTAITLAIESTRQAGSAETAKAEKKATGELKTPSEDDLEEMAGSGT